MEEWIKTECPTFGIQRKLGNVYEFYQVVETYPENEQSGDVYQVSHGLIDPENVDRTGFAEDCGDEWPMTPENLAEYEFEINQYDGIIQSSPMTFDEAVDFIGQMSGYEEKA